jgi:THO complex subunit 2
MPPPLQAPDYKYVTEECLREWKGQSAAAAAFRLPDPVPMQRFLYELCWAVVSSPPLPTAARYD